MRGIILIIPVLIVLGSFSFSQETQEFLVEMAQKKLNSGEYSEVFYYINRAIDNEPLNPQYYVMRSMAYAGTDNITVAFQELKTALKIDPNYSLAYYNKGVLYSDYWDKPKKAIKEYDKALEINSKYKDALFNRASVKFKIGEVDAAMEDLGRLLNLYPDEARAYVFRARLFLEKRDSDAAKKNIIRAVEIEPKNSKYLVMAGLICLANNEKPEACFYFESAEQLGNEKAKNMLSQHCQELE